VRGGGAFENKMSSIQCITVSFAGAIYFFYIMMMTNAFAASLVFKFGCLDFPKCLGKVLFNYVIVYMSLAVIVSTFISFHILLIYGQIFRYFCFFFLNTLY
jgi:hypothetical protein